MPAGVCTVLSFLGIVMASDMKCIGHDSSNKSMFLTTCPIPVLKAGEVLIKVSAAGVNRMDLMQVAGNYPPPPGSSEILGVEVSGFVHKMSAEAVANSDLKEGDRVMTLVGGGGYAEYCVAPYQVVMRVPENVTMTDAAGLPEIFLTVYQAFVFNGHLKNGESVLIHAGGSGVGLAAIQLCRQTYKDIKIITTAGTEEKLAICRKYGADVTINYKTTDFVPEVMSATENKGVDVILDPIGAPYWSKHSKCTAIDGRVLHIAFLGGKVAESVNFGPELHRRVTHNFSTLRSRSLEYKQELISQFMRHDSSYFEGGALKVPVDSVFPMEDVEKAHTRIRENKNIGKIIITVP